MRGLLGKLNWATRQGMPQGCGDASLLSSRMSHPKVSDLQETNSALRRLLKAEATITIRPIPLDSIRLIVTTVASLGNAAGGNSQLAHLMGAADQAILEGKKPTITCSAIRAIAWIEPADPPCWWSPAPGSRDLQQENLWPHGSDWRATHSKTCESATPTTASSRSAAS
jgi:hypothetical protein